MNELSGLKGLGKKIPLVVGIIVVMYIALPAIGIAIVKGAVHFNFISSDPLYQFVLLLHYAVPPAVSVSKFFIYHNSTLLLLVSKNDDMSYQKTISMNVIMSTNCSTVTACLLRENIIVFLFLNGPHN
jgi:hypothetical protein